MTPRDYLAFVDLLAIACPQVDLSQLREERSYGGYLALRVAADVFLHTGEAAFDIDFYRDEAAQGGIATRLSGEPPARVARAWLVAAHTLTNVGRFFASSGVPDEERLRTAISYDELLRVRHGTKIELIRAGMNAFAFLKGAIPSRTRELEAGPEESLGLADITPAGS
jgi:hypothetical protein